MRLDKFLCDMNIGSRNEVKNLIKKGKVTINCEVIKKPEYKIDENKDVICCHGKEISYEKFRYFMLNKPAGVVSATTDNLSKTVIDLIKEDGKVDLFPVGRLDKDTEGLILLTNDGELAHRLLSPKKHVDKVYYCELKENINKEMIEQLEQGVDIGEKRETLPAKVEVLSEKAIRLTIHEGKFHQVKRMLLAVGNEITYLKRVQMGNLVLDEKLNKGEYRRLSEEETEGLRNLC